MANRRLNSRGINPSTDQVLLASKDRGWRALSDKPVPWFQGTMVIDERETTSCRRDRDGSSSLEAWFSRELNGQAGSDNQVGRSHGTSSLCFHGADDD